MPTHAPHAPLRSLLALLLCFGVFNPGALAADHAAAVHDTGKKKIIEEVAPVASPKEMGDKVREALGVTPGASPNKKLTLMINGKPVATAAPEGHNASTPVINPQLSRQLAQQRAAALAAAQQGHGTAAPGEHGGEVHWAYEGANGPQAWGQLKPEFNVCAIGKRQSPINIEDNAALQGPAEPIQFAYTPSNGTVINNGHTIQVDVQGDNSITIRGSNYRLLQFHFHTPSEEQVNFRRYAMVAHLVHKNAEGQLAVVAVLLEPGESNALIDKVWTYMPLDAQDRVRMPQDLLNMNELLPKDQRYYQFMGSLTTPPCTEGVLWMVLKAPMQMGKNQYRLFTQLYPNNARPVQPANGRPVRDAQ